MNRLIAKKLAGAPKILAADEAVNRREALLTHCLNMTSGGDR